MRDSIDNNKFRLYGPYDKWLKQDGRIILHKGPEFNSIYVFEREEDAKSIFNSLKNINISSMIGGGRIKISFDKEGKKIKEELLENNKIIPKNIDQQRTNILQFALSLYPNAYRLTECRPWWCSSRFRNFADFNRAVKLTDIKNKWKFNQFVTVEEWATERVYHAEKNEQRSFNRTVPLVPLKNQYNPSEIKKYYSKPLPPKPSPKLVSKDDAIKLLEDLLGNESKE